MFYIKPVFFLHLTEYILNKNGNELKLYLLKIIKKKNLSCYYFLITYHKAFSMTIL